MAAPVVITDTYIGSDDHGYGDVIGAASEFDIQSMEVDLVGTTMTVTVNTNFGAGNGLGTFPSYTTTTYGQGKGIGFGDLFLSSTGWDPHGSAPYMADDYTTGTVWDYAISLADRWNGVSSAATLYQLHTANGNTDVLRSEQFVKNAIFRNGQEVAVKTSSAISLGSVANVLTSGGQVVFSFDIAGTALEGASAIGLHWAMTCGNDTIEGQFSPVPEPSTLALVLFGFSIMGVASVRRRKLHGDPLAQK